MTKIPISQNIQLDPDGKLPVYCFICGDTTGKRYRNNNIYWCGCESCDTKFEVLRQVATGIWNWHDIIRGTQP